MFPTAALFSKASRLPLLSKHANKNYYKGTGAGNVLRRRRVVRTNRRTGAQIRDLKGRPSYYTIKTDRLDESKVLNFIVPPGLGDTTLRPLVWQNVNNPAAVKGPPARPYPNATEKMDRGGFNVSYYEYLRKTPPSERTPIASTKKEEK